MKNGTAKGDRATGHKDRIAYEDLMKDRDWMAIAIWKCRRCDHA